MVTSEVLQPIQQYSKPFKNIEDLRDLIKAASKAKYVLLGEATHGTAEFYTIRADVSKKLISEHGFSFIAVEGDWPSCYEVNRYIKGRSNYNDAKEVLSQFQRWPTWMWANEEIIPLIEWLKEYNQSKQEEEKVGFYGIDVYSLWESMESIITYMQKINSPDLEKAMQAITCFQPYNKRPEQYGMSAAFLGESCREEVLELLHSIVSKRKQYLEENSENYLNLQMNGLVSKNAESYYKTMLTDDTESWNIRDHHMVEALEIIRHFYGEAAKGIVWEHNTHIGDARATSMEQEGIVNVGQITREKFGSQNVYAIGFGTYKGTVIAAEKWGDSYKIMNIPKAQKNSWEEQLHRVGAFNQTFIFTEDNRRFFNQIIGHRAIGVIYEAAYEQYGNYVPTKVSERYDGFIFVDHSTAVTPIAIAETSNHV
ncbi:protein-L-isoaspartate O-methyltransferase [Niallia circulans]|jgi:erythromycin esterase-like protein|uniref:erythromycin esterase family protein n=1 Tax=Niallia circulans TaxID=1397 RepID=UPI00201DD77C|nr:erythromycin esterase family protein [Niallia circulans]UQZ73902.1 protein-L-isoaspartate O-methyltransferase [Niallia circulans]